MWALGGDSHPAYQAELKSDRLRYRMLPYIYTLAGEATHHAGTIMRPLVMDFAADSAARELADEYMFGPAFLVAPLPRTRREAAPCICRRARDGTTSGPGRRGSPGRASMPPLPTTRFRSM